MTSFVLAHLSDPHLAPLPRPRWHELAGKRALGHLNWTRNRHLVHRRPVLDALIADVKAQRPDHIAITGDIVNLALNAEFEPALAWLKTVGAPDDVTIVPGNHDAYARATRHHFARLFRDYLGGDHPDEALPFPFVRRRGPLALVGVSTAVPSAPFMATGTIGAAQLRRLDALLTELRDAPVFRVMLIHHPLAAARAWHARLTDADAMLRLLRKHHVDLVAHGHDHRHALVWIEGPGGRIPVLGVPSASVGHGDHREPAAYNLYAISGANGHWHCEITTRSLTRDGTFAETRRMRLRP
jgi:3',5'-cyclic AMP phosphodiesterase CpdA